MMCKYQLLMTVAENLSKTHDFSTAQFSVDKARLDSSDIKILLIKTEEEMIK